MEDLKKSFLIHGSHIVGLSDKNFSTCPLGTVLSFAGQTAPHGYLLCDGASYKVADYPHLYAVIGNTYGGDTENFNVPNLVDKFIQGSTTSGTEKEAGLPNIEGNVGYLKSVANTDLTKEWNGAFKWATYSASSNTLSQTSSANTYDLEFDASKSNPIYGNSDTVQPPALTMVYIIKAFHTNEGVDSGVSDDVIDYVDGELATKKDVAKLLNNATDSTKWIKLKLGNSSTFQPIIVSDQYGGKVEITGMANDGTYRSVKLVRYSYGDWTTHHATSFTTTSAGDGNYKIRRLYYYPTDGYYYLEIRQWATIKVEGSSTAEMITSLPAEASEMTLIPESNWGRIDDTSTGSTSTWSSSKIAQQDGVKQVYTASATAYPVNFWILSDDTSGVFWFKHTFSREDTVKMVEGYADLTNDKVIITTNVGEVGPRISTDSVSGKKGVIIGIQMQTGDVKITEARPITATPTRITPR